MDDEWYLVKDDGTCIAYEQTLSAPIPNDTTNTLILPVDTILETMLLVEPMEQPKEPPKQSFYHSHRVIENGHHYFLDPAHTSDGDMEQQTDEATHSIDRDENVKRLKKRGQNKKRKCYTNRPHRTKILSPQQQSKHDQRLQQRVKREVNYLLKTGQKR